MKPLSGKEKKAKSNGTKPTINDIPVNHGTSLRRYLGLLLEHGAQMDVEGGESDDEDWERVAVGPSSEVVGAQPAVGATVGEWFVERAKFIPLRLSIIERKYLRLLEAALSVSEYTDKIDTLGFGLSKAKRIVHQIRELCAIMSGLLLSADYKRGQELFTDRDFQANAEFYQQIFELGRRHKIMNPDKMRTTYGKLIYLLQVRLISRCARVLRLLNLALGQSNPRSQGALGLLLCPVYQDGSQRPGGAQHH